MTSPGESRSFHDPRRFVFVLLPEFSLLAFTSAIEPLRVANRMHGSALYTWRTASFGGEPVTSSCGATIVCDLALSERLDCDAVVACAGLNTAQYCPPEAIARLRELASRGVALGSVCTGSVLLAKAGLLDGHRCTIHWEDAETFAENFPALDVTSNLYEIDRRRFTCSGGTAPLDMMIEFIASAAGGKLAARVADQLVHHGARKAGDPQRMTLAERTGVRHRGLLDVIALMEANLESPMPLAEIGARAGLSLRQIERLFALRLRTSPARYYLLLRLQRARQLVLGTDLPMLQVAVSTGFVSAGHFTRCYRTAFGLTPSRDRTGGRPRR